MSAIERLVLWLHVAFVIFTIGPVTVAIMSSPRAIRTRNAVLLQHLLVMTRIFGTASLGVLVFGIILGQQQKELSKAWLTVSMTLFVVALVLLVLIMRDQRRALAALKLADKQGVPAPQHAVAGELASAEREAEEAEEEEAATAEPAAAAPVTAASHIANVERGRIVSMGGVVSLIWLVILVLMVWNA
jgi:nucleoid-associated protein YgaU